jgi:D-alanyl-D-alanine carboxypeptidase (penicillin-binding protein 5/6)
MLEFFKKKKIFFFHVFFVFLSLFLAWTFFELLKIENTNRINLQQKIGAENFLKNKKVKEVLRIERENKKKEIFKDISLEAKSFLIFDLEKNEEVFSRNKDKKLGIASLTKIATSEIFLESSGNENVKVSFKNLEQEGEYYIYMGEVFSPTEALDFTMISSSNDMASALTNELGQKVFLEKMNALAENLDMKSTLFFSESGLDVSEKIAGSYSTASDVSKLVRYFYKKNPEVSKSFSVKEKKICSDLKCHELKNTNKIFLEQEEFPYEILFSKTGYTEKTGGSLVMINKILGKDFLIVILGSEKEGRFEDMKSLVKKIELL